MAIGRETGQVDLADVFLRVQGEMLAQLSVSRVFEHSATKGTASEQDWVKLLGSYLPRRYRAAPAFIVNADGRVSKQIDIAIFDTLHSPPLFPHAVGTYVPVESVYAVVEVKTKLNSIELNDAADKIGSVRCLQESLERPVLGVVCATAGSARRELFAKLLKRSLPQLSPVFQVDLGCALDCAGFEYDGEVRVSLQEEGLIFFLLRLLARLDAMGPAPAVDFMRYVRTLESFRM